MRSPASDGSVWARLPHELGDAVRPRIPEIARACVDGIAAEIPEYSGSFGRGPTRVAAIEQTRRGIERDIDRVGTPALWQADRLAEFRGHGREAFHNGLSREAAQAAVRVSSRVTWRWIADIAREAGLSGDVLYGAAEGMFADVETSMAAISEGYRAAEAAMTGTGERHRRLLRALLGGRTPAEVDGLIAASGLPVPARLAAVAFRALPGAPEFPPGLLPEHVPADPSGDPPAALTPAPDPDLAGLVGLPAGWTAAVGPLVPPAAVPESFRVARRALELSARGLLDNPGPVVWCRDHLTTLLLLADEFLVSQLASATLAPLSGLPERRREQLAETLLALVRTRGSAPELGRLLELHPQTVRARLKKLGELFGSRLDDPGERLRMELALLAERALPGGE
ncbi:PucR C-terminal helix-turn-helix domain-containing protein [Amycolatopsis pretoriensis]|uniref:PucR C-terminal helix-turn-helix domain-containing protein n=1 Tax=Amycolatopsis pretoriensis TaxID=218821 RepID=A0A1H5QJK8_9PSEU|nr:PucR family transcriptional regulator [Amycolatopsis pretoriensis]SEF26225.1 PucR C-terminal helix-turn-helix domain-containing protein [Amycolatopsis pretoriensis]